MVANHLWRLRIVVLGRSFTDARGTLHQSETATPTATRERHGHARRGLAHVDLHVGVAGAGDLAEMCGRDGHQRGGSEREPVDERQIEKEKDVDHGGRFGEIENVSVAVH